MRKKLLYTLAAAVALSGSALAFNGTTAVLADSVRYEAEDATIQRTKLENSRRLFWNGVFGRIKNDSTILNSRSK